nr:DUF4374 domain-containing protein [uncultured Carboxylicivirga sp.]
MKVKNQLLGLILFAVLGMVSFTSCEKEDGDGQGEDNSTSKYLVIASSGENDYLVTGDAISTDYTFDATSASALQSVGNSFWTFIDDKVAYGFLYNQTAAGTTGSYVLNENGEVEQRNEIGLEVSIHTKGVVNGKLVVAYSDRLRDVTVANKAYFYEIDPETDISEAYTVVTNDLLEVGEAGYLTDIAQYEGYMIAGARSISSSNFSSDYFNNTYVVVFNSDYTVKQVIKDEGRTGFVAGQKYSQGLTGLEVAESGDLYVFSSGQTNYVVADETIIPSGILKINAGEFEFDKDYFFNITEASGGYNLFRSYYMGGSTFILSMYPGIGSNATFGVNADRFAVVDVAAKTFNWVSGFAVASGIEDDPFLVGEPFVDSSKNQLIVPVVTSDNDNYLYTINPINGSASKQSEVIAEGVSALGILTYQE